MDAELRVEIGSVERLVDDNTVALIGIAGTTEFGQIDPIPDLASLATSYNLFLHVDAAFGGFVIPFLDDKYDFDFRINGVSSISVDPHKMGMSTIPAGVLLFRERSYLEELSISTPYLSTKCQYSLIGTRSGASVAATYAVLKHLGYEGLRSNVKRCMKLTRMLVECAKGFDVFPVIEPVMNVVALDVPDVRGVIKALNEKGWSVSKTRDPEALRLVVMPHTKEENINAFVDDLWGVVK